MDAIGILKVGLVGRLALAGLLLAVGGASASAQLGGTEWWNQITNAKLGEALVLDTDGTAGNYFPNMNAEENDRPGQFWRLKRVVGGANLLTTAEMGPCITMQVTRQRLSYDGPFLKHTDDANITYQLWNLIEQSNGTYWIQPMLASTLALDLDGNNRPVLLPWTNSDSQRWYITRVGKIEEGGSVPAELHTDQDFQNEGKIHDFYAKSTGTLKTLMMFTEFKDKKGTGSTTDHSTGLLSRTNGNAYPTDSDDAYEWFDKFSYGKLELEVTVLDGWRELPGKEADYDNSGGDKTIAYFKDSIEKVDDEVDFSEYDYVCLVAPDGASGFDLSPAHVYKPGNGVDSDDGEVTRFVTFGTDSYINPFVNFVHETGHILGLPDLYPYEADDDHTVGPWDVMGDMQFATSYLGWHRHLFGWLDSSRSTYLDKSGNYRFTLTSLDEDCGTAIVVIPMDKMDPPAEVLVIEVATPILNSGKNGRIGDGILIYRVDGEAASGNEPIYIDDGGAVDLYSEEPLFKEGDSYRTGRHSSSGQPGVAVRIEKKIDGVGWYVEFGILR